MSICKDCIHYEICDEYVSPCESFPETDGCKCFKAKADVVEVRHGEWLSVESDVRFKCSVCDAEVSTSWDYEDTDMFKYCPCCGAKMDGEERKWLNIK